MIRRSFVILAFLAASLSQAAAQGDDIRRSLGEAQRAYQSGDLGATRIALEEALQLLAQRRAAGLARSLPGPLPGWAATDVPDSMQADLTDGTSASRSYRNAGGQSVQVSLTIDNPMTAQFAMILTNPGMAGSMGRLIRIDDRRALQIADDVIQMPVDNRILVTITGDGPNEAKLA
nr:hypothetical protein [uncultured Roseococcus sp.]